MTSSLGWRRTTSATCAISAALKVLPVGLCGELSTSTLVRGVICGGHATRAWESGALVLVRRCGGAAVRRCGASVRRDGAMALRRRGGAMVRRDGVAAAWRRRGAAVAHRGLEPRRVERVAQAALVGLQRARHRLAARDAHLAVVQVEGRLEQHHLPRVRQSRPAQRSS
jgi:hypothetical protein